MEWPVPGLWDGVQNPSAQVERIVFVPQKVKGGERENTLRNADLEMLMSKLFFMRTMK